MLQPGDVIAAFNGNRRVARVGQENFRFFVPPGASYSLTIHRDGVEQTVTLTPQTGPTSAEHMPLAYGTLVNALALLVVGTLIAVYGPELPLSRVGYIAALLVTVGYLGIARGDELFSTGRASVGDYAHQLWSRPAFHSRQAETGTRSSSLPSRRSFDWRSEAKSSSSCRPPPSTRFRRRSVTGFPTLAYGSFGIGLDHQAIAMLFVTVATGAGLASFIIEPATTRAAFGC